MARTAPAPTRLLAAVLICALVGCAHSLTPAEALLAQKDAIVNWPQFYAGNNMTGWTDAATDPCTWSGVVCVQGAVTQLNLACWRDQGFCSVQAMGSLARELAQISTLEIIDVRKQLLSGYLPRDWGVAAMPFRQLLLGYNNIQDTLPDSWGLGIFPRLEVMGPAANNWTGTLPAQWGGANAFPKLQQLTITCHQELPYERRFSGTIPSSSSLWRLPMPPPAFGAFPSLIGIDLSYGALTGTLPASWGSSSLPNLALLSLKDNKMSGPLPDAYGAPGAFKILKSLALQNNSLTGPLPDSWAQAGSFPRLQNLTLDINTLTGGIPASWGADTAFPSLQVFTVEGNPQLCGAVPVSLQSAVCSADGSGCVTTNGAAEIPCQAGTPTPVPAGTPPTAPSAAALLPPAAVPIASPSPAAPSPIAPSPIVPSPVAPSPVLPSPALPPPASLSPPPSSPPPLVAAPPPAPSASPPSFSAPAQPPAAQLSPASPPPLLPPPSPPANGTVTAESTPPASTSSSSSAPIGTIVGGVVGGLAALAAFAFFALRPGKGWLRRAGSPPSHAKSMPPAAEELGAAGGGAGKPPGSGGGGGSAMDSFLSCGAAIAPLAAAGQPRTGSGPGASSQSSGPPTSSLLDSFLAGSASADAGQAAALAAAAAAAGSQPDARTTSTEDDALLSYISSRLSSLQCQQLASIASSAAGGMAVSSMAISSGASSHPGTERSHGSSGSSLHASMAQWEVFWRDITIIKPVKHAPLTPLPHFCTPSSMTQGLQRAMARDPRGLQEFSDASEPGVLALPASTMRQLQEEAAVMAKMRHPNLVNFMGLCMVPPCILTEFCAKGSLYAVLQRARQSGEAAAQLGWGRRLGMALDAAVGLLYLHSLQPAIIHRDVKSPNLLVDKAWTVKVADFNLSKIMSNTTSMMSTGTGAANPLWLAPEILAGGSATAASDVYSFGVVLYELLTWRLPWEGVSAFKIAMLVLEGGRPAVQPREALPGPDTAGFEGLDAYLQLMRDCWVHEPYERPTFKEVVPRLRALLNAYS
ncbi:hypothetical protein ABPG75_000453 [Micractinium tetrahymenae]